MLSACLAGLFPAGTPAARAGGPTAATPPVSDARRMGPPAAMAGPAKPDDPDPPVARTVIHTDAYKKREGLGPHLDVVVTPPERRGKKGRVLVELYNYSKSYINVADFWLEMRSATGDKVEVHITADDIKAGWSALKWVKIAGKKPTIPKIAKVSVDKMQMFDAKGKKLALKVFVDLIKE